MKKFFVITIFITGLVFASPILQMNKAFMALTELIPYLTKRDEFMLNKNSKSITKALDDLQKAFSSAKHDPVIKEDLFSPSYKLINENVLESQKAFRNGNKDYAYWRLKEITSHCLDCHTRLPVEYASSFQNGEMAIDEKKFDNLYNLGLAQLIVRRYVDAKATMIRYIDEKFIKNDFNDITLPFKQILLVDAKTLKSPDNFLKTANTYLEKKNIPEDLKYYLNALVPRLKHWNTKKVLSKGINSDKDLKDFIKQELVPLKKLASLDDGNDVDILIASGLLSNYLFKSPDSKEVPEIIFWLGWTEKYLKRGNFFGSGDLFFKLCMNRYSKSPIAKECFAEYKESVEFDFSGSAGTNIPEDVKNELEAFKKMIDQK